MSEHKDLWVRYLETSSEASDDFVKLLTEQRTINMNTLLSASDMETVWKAQARIELLDCLFRKMRGQNA